MFVKWKPWEWTVLVYYVPVAIRQGQFSLSILWCQNTAAEWIILFRKNICSHVMWSCYVICVGGWVWGGEEC